MITDLQELHDVFAKRLRKHQEIVAGYVARLGAEDVDVAAVIHHSDSLFEAAAAVNVYGPVVDILAKKLSGDPETKLTADTLYDYVMRETVNKASHIPHSSSQTSNLVARYELVAWAKVTEYMRTGF